MFLHNLNVLIAENEQMKNWMSHRARCNLMGSGHRVMVGSRRRHIPIQSRGVLILLSAQECHHWPSRGQVPQPAARPPMLIGGSEAFGGMQISPALL